MKRVLLLNPPSRFPVSRDYYCGHFTKGRHSWPPLDLLVLSGQLSEGCDIAVLDAAVERLDPEQALRRVTETEPDAVVALTASVSWPGDMEFLSRVKKERPIPVFVSGDYARAKPEAVLADHACIDGVILDFVDNGILEFLAGEGGSARNIHTRQDPGDPVGDATTSFSYPLPRHELFPLKRYRRPQSLHHPGTAILTDFGCPFSCDFCFMERLEHRLRDLRNVAQELARIRELGVRELLVADQSFGSHRRHARAVCDAIRDAGRGSFSWEASMRVDDADQDLLETMFRSGCHTVMFGVETPTRAVLDAHKKGTNPEQVRDAFTRASAVGLRTLAHFIVGLTGEDEGSLEELVRFAIELDPDIASFNVAAPAWNTSFGDQVREKGWSNGGAVGIANPGGLPTWQGPGLDRETVLKIRDEAVRRFYMRPSYMFRQLTRVRSLYQLKMLFREGIDILSSGAGFARDRKA